MPPHSHNCFPRWVLSRTYVTQLFGIDLSLQQNGRVRNLSELGLIWVGFVGVLEGNKGVWFSVSTMSKVVSEPGKNLSHPTLKKLLVKQAFKVFVFSWIAVCLRGALLWIWRTTPCFQIPDSDELELALETWDASRNRSISSTKLFLTAAFLRYTKSISASRCHKGQEHLDQCPWSRKHLDWRRKDFVTSSLCEHTSLHWSSFLIASYSWVMVWGKKPLPLSSSYSAL